MTHDLTKLKEFWRVEFLRSTTFSWLKLFNKIVSTSNERKFYFWWRLANEMFMTNKKRYKRTAAKVNKKQIKRNNIEIMLGAKIGKGLKIVHFSGLVVTDQVKIGENFTCHQFVTIGVNKKCCNILIGDNVTIGCNSVIIGGNVKIGNNVYVGAMSFINKDIPDNYTVFTEKKLILR